MPEKDDRLEKRKAALERKLRNCHLVAWPSLVIGVAFLLCGNDLRWMAPAMVFLFIGVAARVYSYILKAERRSLSKIEDLAKRTGSALALASLLLLPTGRARAAGLEVGAKAAELDNLEWLEKGPVKIFSPEGAKKDDRMHLILFWGTWDKNSPLIFSRLADIRANRPKDKLSIVAITTDRKPAAENFLSKLPGGAPPFAVAADSKRKTAEAYMSEGVGVPLIFIVGADGDIIWKGAPAFIEEVVDKIFSGRFDPKTQAEISKLHAKLAEFLQLEDMRQIVRFSEKILALDPSDAMATRVRIYVFERMGKPRDALEFMNGIVEKSPPVAGPYLVRLDLMDRLGEPLEKRHAAAKEILEKFNDDPTALSRLASMAMERMAFGSAPLETALKAAERAVEILDARDTPPPSDMAAALSARARVYHATGRLEKALGDQKRVVGILKGRPSEKAARQILEYYEKALELRGKQ